MKVGNSCCLMTALLVAGCASAPLNVDYARLEPLRVEPRVAASLGHYPKTTKSAQGIFALAAVSKPALNTALAEALRVQYERNAIELEKMVFEVLDSEIRQSGKFRMTSDAREARTTVKASIGPIDVDRVDARKSKPQPGLEIRVELIDVYDAVLWCESGEIRPVSAYNAEGAGLVGLGRQEFEAAWRAAAQLAISAIVRKM